MDKFHGDKLTRNQLQSRDGVIFDVRNITSPIMCLLVGDNISRRRRRWMDFGSISGRRGHTQNRTIVYSQNHKSGYLALFVSTKVGAKQVEEFVQLMDVIDCLAPGLNEMVISNGR